MVLGEAVGALNEANNATDLDGAPVVPCATLDAAAAAAAAAASAAEISASLVSVGKLVSLFEGLLTTPSWVRCRLLLMPNE